MPGSSTSRRRQQSSRSIFSQKGAASSTDTLISSLEGQVIAQKADKYKKYDTVIQRENALAVLQELTEDISSRYNETKAEIREAKKRQRELHQLQHQKQLAGVSEDGSILDGSSTAPSDSEHNSQQQLYKYNPNSSLASSFLNYQLPQELRSGPSFTLIPGKTFGASTALRLTRTSTVPLSSRGNLSSEGQSTQTANSTAQRRPLSNTLAVETSDAVVKTRWELEKEQKA